MNICITLAATAIFSMLVPSGGTEKVLKFTISLFFCCCLLSPFLHGLPQLDWKVQTSVRAENTALTERINEQLLRQSEKNVCRAVGELLDAENISYEKISADVNISSDNSIFISKLFVELPIEETPKLQRVKALLEEQCQTAAEVTVSR